MFHVLASISTEHDWRLVMLAALVCLPATVASFYLYSKAPPFPAWRRRAWLSMTGLVAGAGVWTTHFIAMLAFDTGLPVAFAGAQTVASLGLAVVGTTLGFTLGSLPVPAARRRLTAIGGGLVVGLAITGMHFLGMLGYRTTGVLQWDPAYVVASAAVGAAFAAAALSVARPGADLKRQAAAGVLLSLGVFGMHFTGMTAVTILPDPSIVMPTSLVTHGVMSEGILLVAAVAVTALIVVTSIGGVALSAAGRSGNLRRLREALDVLPDGLAFYDAADRLVAWNNQYETLFGENGVTLAVGDLFSDLIKASLIHGACPAAVGRETEWLAERNAIRKGSASPLTQLTAGGRWLRVTDRRTSDGGTVTVSVDITELKKAEAAIAQARDKAEEQAGGRRSPRRWPASATGGWTPPPDSSHGPRRCTASTASTPTRCWTWPRSRR